MQHTGGTTVARPARTSRANGTDHSAKPTQVSRTGLRPKMSEDRRGTATVREAAEEAEVLEDREAAGRTGVGKISHPVVTRGTTTRGARMVGTVVITELMQKGATVDALPEEGPSWPRVSSHRIILDGCFSQGRKEPVGSSVGRTTTSLPPGRPSQREL